jgi:branched-chain amino acid transport system ATP-binding protein
MAAQGRTIVIVDQTVAAALGLADGLYVLNNGQTVFKGAPPNMRRDPTPIRRA